jgi:hypothetical protein
MKMSDFWGKLRQKFILKIGNCSISLGKRLKWIKNNHEASFETKQIQPARSQPSRKASAGRPWCPCAIASATGRKLVEPSPKGRRAELMIF